MPRINPDKTKQHGLHQDLFWPGEIHSVWNADGWAELRRERRYNEPNHRQLVRESWQLSFRFGPHTIGIRWERSISDDRGSRKLG